MCLSISFIIIVYFYTQSLLCLLHSFRSTGYTLFYTACFCSIFFILLLIACSCSFLFFTTLFLLLCTREFHLHYLERNKKSSVLISLLVWDADNNVWCLLFNRTYIGIPQLFRLTINIFIFSLYFCPIAASQRFRVCVYVSSHLYMYTLYTALCLCHWILNGNYKYKCSVKFFL